MDFEGFYLSIDFAEGPSALDALERNLWLDFLRAPVLDAVIEQGIEMRFFGPLQATVVAALPEEPLLHLLLGAAEPGAVSEGHLEGALEWIEDLGLDCRVPLDPSRPEATLAEELLNHRGYERTESQVRFMRESAPPGLPSGIEVIELTGFTEGFGEILCEGYGMSPHAGWLFDCLPGRESWRCYFALDERGFPCAAAAMLVHSEAAAQLGFAATDRLARGQGFHHALLNRCIRDAARRCPQLVAETAEPLDEPDGPSPGCRNLLRAGFKQASVRTTWRREAG